MAATGHRARPRVERSQRQYGQEGIMSVFGSIVSAIFGSKHAANVAPSAGATPGSPASAPSGPATSSGATAGAAAAKPISREDVEAILKRLHDDQKEDFDWRRSIV